MSESHPHLPVLLDEVLDLLNPDPGGIYVDGTLGAGGHGFAVLEASSPGGRLIGFDRDPDAIALASERLSSFGERFSAIHAPYSEMGDRLPEMGIAAVDGILLDLGYSSMQIDDPARGFSFREDGPLDMRFDSTGPFSAADLVNTATQEELADIIFRYGEDRHARRIARAIVEKRPFERTGPFAEVVRAAQPRSKEKIDPATRTFQALRIAVNDELGHLERVLPAAIDLLKSGGRIAVISFHSLEDRIVKNVFRDASRDYLYDPDKPFESGELTPTLKPVTRKPVTASDQEIEANPRARSAKLRVAEHL